MSKSRTTSVDLAQPARTRTNGIPSGRTKKVTLIGVPMDLGSSLRGVDMGPSAIRIAGLARNLSVLGLKVNDLGNINVPHAHVAEGEGSELRFMEPIVAACAQTAEVVEQALQRGTRPLILGGDHSIAIGSLAGLARFGANRNACFGLLWVDAHGDCNTLKTSPSGNVHGMPLALILGMGEKRFKALAPSPMIEAKHTVLFGVRDLDRGEKNNMRKLGLRVITMREIDERGVHETMREALQIVSSQTAGFHLSFDIDSLDPRFAPGVGTPVPGGLTMREAHLVMEHVADSTKMCSCEMVEVNPVLDDKNTTAELACQLLASAFGSTIY